MTDEYIHGCWAAATDRVCEDGTKGCVRERQDGGRRTLGSHAKCCAGCPYPERPCAKPIDCGEACFLPAGHAPPCLCIGDVDGEPDTCPA